MPIDALPDDLDTLRALVNQLSSKRDTAIAESHRLTEQTTTFVISSSSSSVRNSASGPLAERDAEEEEQQQNNAADKPADQRKSGASTGRAAGESSSCSCHA